MYRVVGHQDEIGREVYEKSVLLKEVIESRSLLECDGYGSICENVKCLNRYVEEVKALYERGSKH